MADEDDLYGNPEDEEDDEESERGPRALEDEEAPVRVASPLSNATPAVASPNAAPPAKPTVAAPNGSSAPPVASGASGGLVASPLAMPTPKVAEHHGFVKALDTIGTILAPNLTARIPGSTLNTRLENERAQKQYGEQVGAEQKQAQTAVETAQAGEMGANTALSQARLHALNQPQPYGQPVADAQGNLIQPMKNPDGSVTSVKIGSAGVKTPEEVKQRMAQLDIQLRQDPSTVGLDDRAKLAEAQRQELAAKIPEEIKAKISDGPVPADVKYPLGYADPKYQKDLQAWSQKLDEAEKSTPAYQAAQATRDATAAQRQFTNSLASQAQTDREAMQHSTLQGKEIQPVIGTDPKTGKTVLVSQAEAERIGLTNIMKGDSQDVTKAQSARQWIPLAAKTGTIQRVNPSDPSSPAANADQLGILQLIDDLDKRGKLGPVASRWNDFLAGKVGAGDPEVEALRTKMGLSTTLLMNAHVGSRGGSYMMEHFQGLADAGKMDASTLKSGVKTELDYIKDRAMLPGGEGEQGGGGKLTVDEARGYLQKAGGDKDKARALARADGRSF